MKLEICNIGKIERASIKLNGITVITGENNSGKSVIGKALYSIINSFYDKETKLYTDKKNTLLSVFSKYNLISPYNSNSFEYDEIIDCILGNEERFNQDKTLLRKCIQEEITNHFGYDFFENKVQNNIDNIINEIHEYILVTKDLIYFEFIKNELNKEFSEQICRISSKADSSIKLTINNQTVILNFEQGSLKEIKNISDISIFTKAIYIDDPFILDNSSCSEADLTYSHSQDLRCLLSKENNEIISKDIVVKEKLNRVLSKLSKVCDGDIKRDKNGSFIFDTKELTTPLSFINVSSGLKTFAFLKALIKNNSIEQHGTIILDEPESHLHPEWQIVLAEIIVLLHEAYDVNILLNTHSPYILRAIQVYSAKYKVDQNCNYYFSEVHNSISTITDVTFDISKIYKKLSRPLQILSDEESCIN